MVTTAGNAAKHMNVTFLRLMQYINTNDPIRYNVNKNKGPVINTSINAAIDINSRNISAPLINGRYGCSVLRLYYNNFCLTLQGLNCFKSVSARE